MGDVKIPYYQVRAGRGYWTPNQRMLQAGARGRACGVDGPDAWRIAAQAHNEWLLRRQSLESEHASGQRAKPNTLAYAFQVYRSTAEWQQKKSQGTKNEWWRCWERIGPAFGNVKISTITLKQISAFRALVAARVSEREAHRCIKIWRALWKIAAAQRLCRVNEDPSLGVRNTEPPLRQAVWSYGEARLLFKEAWRSGYHGLATIIAIAWDTSMSPVDVRSLTPSQREGAVFFGKRKKTGRQVIGTLGRGTVRVLDVYAGMMNVNPASSMPLCRNRSGTPYSKDTLTHDFAAIRAAVFGAEERRRLGDFRRSGTVEAIRGGATDRQIGTKLGNAFSRSNLLQQTYGASDLATAKLVDEARKRGRRRTSEELRP